MFFVAPANNFYVDEYGDFYDFDGSGELAGIGSFFKKITKAVAPVAAGFIPVVGGFAAAGLSAALGGGGSTSGVAKGLAAINQFGAGVIDELNRLKQNIGENPEETISQAKTLAGYLSDSNRVFQAKKGKDAQALANFKQQAAQIVGEIENLAVRKLEQMQQAAQMAQSGGGQVVQLPNGQMAQAVQLANGQVILQPVQSGGMDTNTLLMFGGGALVLILLLTRR